jgi:Ca2+-binding RTX toxin-like protein
MSIDGTGKSVVGGPRQDVISTGSGSDTIILRGSEAIFDIVDAGDGDDTLVIDANGGNLELHNFVNDTKSVTIGDRNGSGQMQYGVTGVETVVTNGKTIVGAGANQGNNVFDFSKTKFKIDANANSDIGATVDVGGSDDKVIGTSLGDTIWGGWGRDTLNGGAGDDQLYGGDHADLLEGDQGNDTLDGGADSDTVNGGGGNDTILSRGSEAILDIVDGGTDNDTLVIEGDRNLELNNFVNANSALKLDAKKNAFGMTSIETVVTNGKWIVGAGANQSANVFDFSQTTFKAEANGPAIGANVDAGGGDDTVVGSKLGDMILGGWGHDKLDGGVGDDKLYGGDNNDTLTGGEGNDLLDGGSGYDIANFQTASKATIGDFSLSSQSITLTNGTLGTDSVTNVEKVVLGDIDLVWNGSVWQFFQKSGAVVAGETVTMKSAGNLWLGFGNDKATGSDAGDVLNLNQGDDSVSARGGDDVVSGHGGSDVIYGDWGRDRLYGGADDDKLYGGDHDDLLEGGDGNDLLDGGANTDTIRGGAGNDTVVSRGKESVVDVVDGGTGNDTLVIDGSGNLELHNFVNSNTGLTIGGKNAWGQSLYGMTGIETVVTNGKWIVGADGNQGNNVFDFSQTTFRTTAGGEAVGAMVDAGGSDDTVIGTSLADTLYGGWGHDKLSGGSGDDKLFGGDHNDLLVGGAGTDLLDGGTGIDTARWTEGNVLLNLTRSTKQGVASFTATSNAEGTDRIVTAGSRSTIEKFEATGANDTAYLSSGFKDTGRIDNEGFRQFSDGGTTYWLKGFESVLFG